MNEFSFVRARNLGLSVIPIVNRTGRPASNIEWKPFIYNLPPEDLCDVWDQQYPLGDEFGIAVIAGPASGLSWIDIDNNNKKTHSVCPKSLFSKAGTPGRDTRFFKWNDKFKDEHNISESRDGKQVAVLFQAHYTIIPPSIRRPTSDGSVYKYIWTGKSLWDLEDSDELDLMPDPSWHLDLPIIDESSFVETNSGRNNKLKSMVLAGYSKGKSDIDIAKEILEYDFKSHAKPLFRDESEGFKANTDHEAFFNARRFTISNFQTAIKRNVEVNLSPEPEIILDDSLYVFKPKVLPAPYPGLISHFCDVAQSTLPKANDTALLGTALSLMSYLSRHRIVSRKLQPNIISIIVSSSGNGKTLAADYLGDSIINSDHVRKTSYKSGAAFIETVKHSPTSLHIIDEAKTFFAAMKSNDTFGADLIEMINGIYSSTNRVYQMPMTAARAKDPKEAMIEYPYLNMCALTHPAGFRMGVGKYLAESGLIARSLIFWDYWDGNDNDDFNSKKILDLRASIINYENILDQIYPIKRASNYGAIIEQSKEYSPTEIEFDESAKELLRGYSKDKSKISKGEESDIIKSILVRHGEMAVKIAQLAFMSDLKSEKITRDHLEWGISVVETLFYNLQPELEAMDSPDDYFGKKATQAIQYLRTRGPTGQARLQQVLRIDENTLLKVTKYLKSTGMASEINQGRGTRLAAIRLDDAQRN